MGYTKNFSRVLFKDKEHGKKIAYDDYVGDVI